MKVTKDAMGGFLMALVFHCGTAYSQSSLESCAALATFSLPKTKVLAAQVVESGQVDLGAGPVALPTFCRAVLQLTPTTDSDIRVELWMPLEWNHTFRGVGNGGFAGVVDYVALADAVKQGYAAAGTDAGHSAAATDASWALDHPEKVIDFGYRAVHLMTKTSQQVLKAFYGAAPKQTFFSSCSDGGREALMEAERYPSDYNGIVAGDPAYDWTGFMTGAMVNSKVHDTKAAGYIPATSLPLINAAVLAACDASDGVTDGVVSNPDACHFDPEVLRCKRSSPTGNASPNACLTAPQVKTLQQLYAGAFTRDGLQIVPGYVPGGELGPNGWAAWITGSAPQTGGLYLFGESFFANMVYDNPQWTAASFRTDEAYRMATERMAAKMNATTNLAPFFSRGGKLILYQGWNDPAVAPRSAIRYFKTVADRNPRQAAQSMRLYMVPGMQHCNGGPGATFFGQTVSFDAPELNNPQHDVNLALEQWVKQGIAPDTLIASQTLVPAVAGQPSRTRPLCAYPGTITYKGSGDTNDASNFSCTLPQQSPSRMRPLENLFENFEPLQ